MMQRVGQWIVMWVAYVGRGAWGVNGKAVKIGVCFLWIRHMCLCLCMKLDNSYPTMSDTMTPIIQRVILTNEFCQNGCEIIKMTFKNSSKTIFSKQFCLLFNSFSLSLYSLWYFRMSFMVNSIFLLTKLLQSLFYHVRFHQCLIQQGSCVCAFFFFLFFFCIVENYPTTWCLTLYLLRSSFST